MTKFRPAVMTDAGQTLATQAESGQIQLTFTKGVLSSDDLTQLGQTAVQQTTALNPFITTTINKSNIISANKIALPLNFSNEQMTSDNYAKTVGVYASDGTTEYLYALCINDAPLLISAYNGATPEALEIEFRTEVGRASTVNVTVSPLDTVNRDQLSAVASSAQSYASVLASSVVINTSAIATHSSAIGALQGSVASISNAVASNSTINSEFSTANSNIATNSSNIISLNNAKEDASQHKADIDNLKNSLKTSSTLPSGTDLNNVTDAGDYQIMWNYTYLNAPIQSKTTMLLSVKNNGNEIYQTIKHPWTDTMLVRKRTFENWSEWTELATAVSVNNAYQNAVNTAKSYSDSKPSITIAMDEGDAINKAQSTTSAGLFLYPTQDDKQKFQSYKHVLGIYSYGLGNLPPFVSVSINNSNTTLFTFNGVYGIYNTATNVITIHGSVNINQTLSGSTQFFSFGISGFNMNEITSSWLNYQTITVSTDNQLANVVGTTNSTSGSINLEGCTINLAYNSSLQPVIPTALSSYTVVPLSNGSDLNTLTTQGNTVYYVRAGTNILNSPFGTNPYSKDYIVQVPYGSDNAQDALTLDFVSARWRNSYTGGWQSGGNQTIGDGQYWHSSEHNLVSIFTNNSIFM